MLEWQNLGDKLRLSLKFIDYSEALAMINKISDIAEDMNHHPDITFGWGYAEIIITTHDKGPRITERDKLFAAKVNAKISETYSL